MFTTMLAIYAVVDILMGRMSRERKTAWVLIVILLIVVGPLFYYIRKLQNKLGE
jgi:cytochrome c biogenesis factor